jgi:Uma2 family endonuclease
MSTITTRLTAEAFWLLPETALHRSLIRGEVIERMPPGARHGVIATAFSLRLGIWAARQGAGIVGTESGFILARDPDVVRGPDVYFIRAGRVPEGVIPEAFWTLAPDLVVEVVSPSETAEEVREKVRDFLAAGTPLVWVVYSRTREVVAHTPDGLARTFRGGDHLGDPAILPGFAHAVGEFFS